MKKKIFAVALTILSLGSLSALAQSPNSASENFVCPNNEQCAPENCNPKECENPKVCKEEKCTKDFKKGKACNGEKKDCFGKGKRKGERKGAGKKGEVGKRNPAAAFDNLNLTPGQKAEIDKILSDKKKDMEKALDKASKERKEIFEKYDKKINKVLSPEQYEKYVKARCKMMHKERPFHGGKKVKDVKNGNKGGMGKPRKGPAPALQTQE